MNHEKFEERLRDIKYVADKFQQKVCDMLADRLFFWIMVTVVLIAVVH